MIKKISLLSFTIGLLLNLPASADTHAPTAKNSNLNAPSLSSKKNLTGNAGTDAIEGPNDLPTKGPLYLPIDLDVPGQSFVSSGPYIGIPLEYSGSNLIINSPNVNEDIALLKIRKNITQRLIDLGRPIESMGSHILLSGIIEGQALYRTAGGGNNNTSDIDLTTVNLDAYVLGPSNWTSGLLEFSYDNNIGTQTGSFSSNDRLKNSRVFVNKAFVVLGDFQLSPFYLSFGQMYVPFGVYSSTMISSPLTKILGRTQARALVIGYKQQTENSLNISGYIFHGPSYVAHPSRINNGGINIDYAFKMRSVHADVGMGVIGNIADSQGMQYTGNSNNFPPLFGGFSGPTETFTNNEGEVVQISTGEEELAHRVPAYNLHTLLGIGDNIQVIGELVAASTSFASEDLAYNSAGAKPVAWSLEGVYNIPRFHKPTSISISYQQSHEALALGLPAKRVSMAINTSYWKSTLQSFELRHDINYGEGTTSAGSGVEGPGGGGHPVNMATFQFDYYF